MNKFDVTIPADVVRLKGILTIPPAATAIVLFAHGSGSSRLSSRNQYVADVLNRSTIATLLFDLLNDEEEKIDDVTREYRFNIELLSSRLIAATAWVLQHQNTHTFSIGYFGASTGGGAALQAAAKIPTIVKAVVSRGGRPDLAGEFLSEVTAPTLLIVGGADKEVIKMNQSAMTRMLGHVELEIVPGATHLFEEHGTLSRVAELAKQWFITYL